MTTTHDPATANDPATEQVRVFEQPDGYLTHYRLWGPDRAADLVVMLHGGMSHSAWQAPLGTRLGRLPGTAFVAIDLRGSGLNAGRGHIPSGELAVEDIANVLRHLKDSYGRIHLAGWCFGAQVATVVAAGRPRPDPGARRTREQPQGRQHRDPEAPA
ncbi:alpha/beta fold hydrolase, partial [Kitasatospora sp. NPDC047058]|uniref:alpha/beta hydrolase n=1 Tax=Kitasatospora sp. NPDC047058 TaxID=3155620 RepID=UPI0033D2D8CC